MKNHSLTDINELSIPERILVVEDIWDSILLDQESVPITISQKEELEKRLQSYYKEEGSGSSWIDVKNRILSH